jgi:4-hydroxy-3-methylbut-2-enyl diphosphate reductase
MKVLVAKKRGFCFGVEHAIEMARKLLDRQTAGGGISKKVYCLGPLIHNSQVVERLAEAGLRVVASLDQIEPKDQEDSEAPTVLVRSHGCRPELLEEINRRGLELADATCILVKRAQKLVSELYQQGYQVVIIGDPDHPEVEGVVGYAPNVIVVNGPMDLEKLPPEGPLAVISQTTYSAEDFGKIVGLIAMRGHGEIKVVNTICRETTRRQASAVELCRQVEVMFVLGSHHSANTKELAELCQRNKVRTYHLQDWKEFEPHYVVGVEVVGVTAGASTPDWIIEEFVENLHQL